MIPANFDDHSDTVKIEAQFLNEVQFFIPRLFILIGVHVYNLEAISPFQGSIQHFDVCIN